MTLRAVTPHAPAPHAPAPRTGSARRRALPVVVLLGLLALLLGACGGDGGDGGSPKAAGPASTTAPGSGSSSGSGSGSGTTGDPGAPHSVVDAMGRSVEVPGAPARIVALSEPVVDGLLAIDLVPAAVTSGRGQQGPSSYLAERLGSVPVVAGLAVPNYEAIAALRPDLILVDGTFGADASTVELLDGIAPTVYVSDAGEDWKVAFRSLGDAIGASDRVAAVLADYDGRVEDLRTRLGAEVEATVSIVRWGLLAPSLILKELPPGRVIADIGFRRPPSQDREGAGHSEPISVEQLAMIDADWIFFGTLGGGTAQGPAGTTGDATGLAASQEALARAETTPGFTNLGAYQSGHIVPVDGSAWMSAGGPLAAFVILDDVAAAVVPGG